VAPNLDEAGMIFALGVAGQGRRERHDVARREDLPCAHDRLGVDGRGGSAVPKLEVQMLEPLGVLGIRADDAERLAGLDLDTAGGGAPGVALGRGAVRGTNSDSRWV